jgi:hypothetical protein
MFNVEEQDDDDPYKNFDADIAIATSWNMLVSMLLKENLRLSE